MKQNIIIDDIPQELADFAHFVGLENFIKICESFGGWQIYFPKKESLGRKARDREINLRYNGCNQLELSREFGLTKKQLQNIINGNRK